MKLVPHSNVKITCSDVCTVKSLMNSSTPGAKKLFTVVPNTTYNISIMGYKLCDVPVRLYIGSSTKTLFYSTTLALKKTNTTLTYQFPVGERRKLFVGLLFHKPNINDKYVVSKISISPIPSPKSGPNLGNSKKGNPINQVQVSSAISAFTGKIRSKYGLRQYYSRAKPAFFFGIYNNGDSRILRKHKSLAIIIWGGTDILKTIREKSKRDIRALIRNKNIHNIAISSFIVNDLKKLGVKPYRINFSLANQSHFTPRKMGNQIYIYGKGTSSMYGYKIYTQVRKKLPQYKFIVASATKYKSSQMPKVYGRCFIGLRLTKHDGNANTVQELGLCGIRCVHNGDMLNAIPWTNVDSIVNSIEAESVRIGTVNTTLANAVRQHLTDNKKWLYTGFYK